MSDNKVIQTGLRLPANVMKAFRVAVALQETTTQQVLEQAVRNFIKSAKVEIEE